MLFSSRKTVCIVVGLIQLLLSRGLEAALADGKLSWQIVLPRFRVWPLQTIGSSVQVLRTLSTYWPEDSLQRNWSTRTCGCMDQSLFWRILLSFRSSCVKNTASDPVEETSVHVCISFEKPSVVFEVERWGSLTKAIRVVAWVRRFSIECQRAKGTETGWWSDLQEAPRCSVFALP